LQLYKLPELRLETYKSSRIYEEKAKKWHDKHLLKKRFKEGDIVLLFNSKLTLFPSKFRSQWSGSFEVIKVYPHDAVDVRSESTSAFKVNG